MQLILDNLTAMIVAGTILVLLAMITLRNGDTAIQAHNMESLRDQQIAFIETLQRDLQNVYAVNSTHDSTGVSGAFSFHARVVDEDDNVLDRRITYQNTFVGTRAGQSLYRVMRWEGAPAAGTAGVQPGDVQAGSSMATLTTWVIRARNEEGENVANPANTRQIYLRFESLPPFEHGDAALDKARFETTFRPPLLQSDDVQPVL